MTDPNLVTPAANGDVGTPAVNGEDVVTISKAELEKIKEKAAKMHEYAGKFHKLNDEVNSKQKKVEAPSDDDDETTKFQKAVKIAVQEEISSKTNYELREKEEKAFLEANPDAYLKLEDIRSLKNKNPELSYNKIYKFFFDEEAEPAKPASVKGQAPKVSDDGDLSRESVNEAFKKMLGK